MANNGNPPIDHYRYLNAKHAKPVLLLMLKHADLPDTIALRLRDNLSNFIESAENQTEINVEINRQYSIMITKPAPDIDAEGNANPREARGPDQHVEDSEQSDDDSAAPHVQRQAGRALKNTRPGNVPLVHNAHGLPLFYKDRLEQANPHDEHRTHPVLLLRTLRHLLNKPPDHQGIAEIENITNLAALNQAAIVDYLNQAGLVTATLNRLDEVLKCNNNITEYVILVFEAYKHRDEERLTWSTTDTGKCLALLIRDMGLICPFNADGTNIHLGTACREWTPTDTHRDFNSYFRNNLARQICPILVGQQRAIRDLRFVTAITVEKTQHRRPKRGRQNNSL